MRKVVFILSLLFCVACSKNSVDVKVHNYTKKIIIASNENDTILKYPYGLTVCNKNLFILDSEPPFVKKYNLEGKYIKSGINKGNGPGELFNPVNIKTFNTYIYIYDDRNQCTNLYDENLVFVKSLKGLGRVVDFNLLDTTKVVYSSDRWVNLRMGKQKSEVFIYSDKKTTLDTILYDHFIVEKPNLAYFLKPFAPKFLTVNLTNGKIFLVNTGDYKTKIIDGYGKVIKNTDVEYEKIEVTKEDKETIFNSKIYMLPNGERIIGTPDYIKRVVVFPKYKDCAKSIIKDNYNGLVLVAIFKNEGNKFYYDVFDSRGDYKYQLALNYELNYSSSFYTDKIYQIEKDKDENLQIVELY